ncbi:probable cytochrome P450 49a1 isoform X2 [Aricia agestis]|uniref:probable cytochrome P450 49a1 isoform X2 n=1 Tax=Aricia agestis TaxID=91739 RepID=UPI001C203AB8|nr:probable cytochrome P450 49a1 isoform X2 [Aricia agestis]
MAKTTISRHCMFHRHISTSRPRRTSTSPQRRNVAAPAVITSRRFTDIPGPLTLPMLRHHDHILPRIGCYHHSVGLGLLEGLRRRYGDLVRLARGKARPVLYVCSADLMQEVYDSKVTESPRWLNSPLDRQRETVAGCPVHNYESKSIWQGVRMLLHDEELLKSYEKAFDEIAGDFTRRLGDLRHADNALNEELSTEVHRWALETIGLMLYGIRLGCLDGPVHEPTEDNRAPERTLDDHSPDLCSLSKRQLDELTPAEKLIRCSLEITDHNYLLRSEHTLRRESDHFERALKAFDAHYSLTELFLTQALSSPRRPEQALLQKLEPLGPRLLPLVSDVFLAGVDPLTHTAMSMFYHLSLHAAKQQKAHDEVLWSKESKAAGIDSPEMKYIQACTREVMRLHPVTGGVVRRSTRELTVGGYEVPAGVDIVLAHGVASIADDQWRRPKSFIPERWCVEGWEPLRATGAHPIASLPFGQTCPAAGIIGAMLASLATRVLDKYRLEWHGPAPNIMTTAVNKLQKPYYFVLQNAS